VLILAPVNICILLLGAGLDVVNETAAVTGFKVSSNCGIEEFFCLTTKPRGLSIDKN